MLHLYHSFLGLFNQLKKIKVTTGVHRAHLYQTLFHKRNPTKNHEAVWVPTQNFPLSLDVSVSTKKDLEYSLKNLETAKNLRWAPKLLHGICRTDLTRNDQNLGRKVEVIYVNKPYNAC